MKEKKSKLDKKIVNNKSSKKEEGITLVALVVTIIILLILAGVAINMALGDNGLFKKAKEAVNTWKSAEENETGALDYLDREWDNLINGGTGTGKPPISDKTTIVKVGNEEVAVPGGFTIVGTEDPTAGQTVADGIVVKDPQGNEWVWVPCYVEGGKGNNIEGRIEYSRTSFDESDITTDFTEELSTASPEYQSIQKYGGYYIGRYEAGDKESTEAKIMRGEEGSTINTDYKTGDATHTVAIKKNQVPYNYVTQAQCVTLSEGMTSVDGSNKNKLNGTQVFTKLCSSYSWDTALKFIQKKYSEYPTNSIQGNYADTTFTYKDIAGAAQIKNENEKVLVSTGQTTPVCSIYDMGGNEWEYTTESYAYESDSYVYRGGTYINDASVFPAGYRNYFNGNAYDAYIGFRPTLFVK